MIISHKHRFIFFAQPRTGTHAIRAALEPHLGPHDWQQQSLTRTVRLPVPELARIGHGHISLRQVQAHLPGEIWRDYFKFAMVRNPYERYVSACTFLNRRNPGYAGTETAFMKSALMRERFRRRVLVRAQVELLVDEAGAVGMDFVGRYERLQHSFDQACERAGVPLTPLTRRNASHYGDYRRYYDDGLLDQVNAFYRTDFDRFDYAVAESAEALTCL